ncbi:hypothetical protein BGX21_001473 [Mortierella sp. AD011]|nr:hypothetical protein BGX21_001473 [Mortierella sp. AD011]
MDIERTRWQPKGCMLRTYDVQHATSCFDGSRVVMVGDSNVRHLYYSVVKKALPNASTEGERHSDIAIRDPESGTEFEFYWDPFLNTTKTQSLLSSSEKRVPSIFLVGSGLWYLRYSELSGGITQWQSLMEKLVPQMCNSRLEPLAQHLFVSPITAVNPEKLSEERRNTILPRHIDFMNDYLRDLTEGSPIVVPFSWNQLTKTAPSETSDVAAAVVYMYYADRTSLFDKGNKFFSWTTFTFLMLLSVVAGAVTLKRSEKDQPFLNRDQTDEWKGWMQIVILIYHYVAASSVSAIYNPVRMLVASYLFMTGFGHFVFYYKKADFGFTRVASIIVRLNLLTVFLTYTMNTDYLAYYFSPLVSVFYLIIYGMMYVGHSYNHNPTFIIGKILITSISTAAIIHYPPVLDTAFVVIKFFYGVTWSAKEWRFRLELDVWIVFVGALFAFGLIKAQEMSITSHPQWENIRRTSIIASVIGLLGYFMYGSSTQKFEYNFWHPYISWIPIISFVILRNSTATLRNTVSTFYTFIGKCSLETFICQFHIWLAGDTKGILVVSPWVEGTGAWTFNLIISSFLFITVSHLLSKATGEVSDWLVSGREPKPSSHASPSAPTPARITTSEAGLPIATRRQSVMVSPIAASAGAVGPATLKSLMEASLAMENLNKSPSESITVGQPNADMYDRRQNGVDAGSSQMAGSSVVNGGSEQARRMDNTVLRIDIDAENSTRASGAPTSALTFKSVWAQPLGKVAIYFGIIWILNFGST